MCNLPIYSYINLVSFEYETNAMEDNDVLGDNQIGFESFDY